MVSVCLPSDTLSKRLSAYLGFSYLGHGVFPHCCSSKAYLLLLTLDEEYLFTATPPDFDCVDHNKLWKILKEIGIPEHLTCS